MSANGMPAFAQFVFKARDHGVGLAFKGILKWISITRWLPPLRSRPRRILFFQFWISSALDFGRPIMP